MTTILLEGDLEWKEEICHVDKIVLHFMRVNVNLGKESAWSRVKNESLVATS